MAVAALAPGLAPTRGVAVDAFVAAAASATSSARAFALRLRLHGDPLANDRLLPSLDAILASPLWLRMTESERSQVLTVAEMLPLRPVERLAANPSETTPLTALALLCTNQTLIARDSNGITILEHLSDLAVLGLNADARATFAEEGGVQSALSAMVEQLADPALVSQGEVGTCSVTVLCSLLLRTQPAEYARIGCELLSAGTTRMADGSTLVYDSNGTEASMILFDSVANIRSPVERAMQSALMEAARPDTDYRFFSNRRIDREGFSASAIDLLPIPLQVLAWILLPVGLFLFLLRVGFQGLRDGPLAALATRWFNRTFRVLTPGDWPAIASCFDASGDASVPMLVGVDHFAGGPHVLSMEGIDRSGPTPAILCRNPWGARAASAITPTEAYGPGFSGVTFVDRREALLRIPLDSDLGRSIASFIVPR